MRISCGKVHSYLGMKLDFCKKGQVKITMIPYIKDMVADFSKFDHTQSNTVTPTTDMLFKIKHDAVLLCLDRAKIFHNFIARALFAAKCVCPDILMAVAFLTTCVTAPDKDDWSKLTHMMCYLCGTPNLALTL